MHRRDAESAEAARRLEHSPRKWIARQKYFLCVLCVSAVSLFLIGAGPVSDFKELLLPEFMGAIPKILASQDKASGHFGTGVWIVTDQNVIWPLAVAWSVDQAGNPYHHDAKLLEAIVKGGDALVEAQDATGQWTFRKKDGSTWGQIYMPWTYSRWTRAYSVVHDAMTAEQRARWDKAIALGVDGIIAIQFPKPLENIPAYSATGVYCAGQLMHREDWCEAAADYLHRSAASQNPDGFWIEHVGPVMNYNFVYVEALGTYYGMSHDPAVLPTLERAARYHANFVYPDGSPVETVDERNGYEKTIAFGNVGFTYSVDGRGYLLSQYAKRKAKGEATPIDPMASIIFYGEDGPAAVRGETAGKYVMGKNDAMTARNGPWFACLSAYYAELSTSRWIQDRQNFVSVFNEKTGLIVGGGNTKLTPLWSTFTAGDVTLLRHKHGDENPDFIPPKGLVHTPSRVTLDPERMMLTMTYGDSTCTARVDISDEKHAKIIYALTGDSSLPVEAHVPLMVHFGQAWQTGKGSGKFTEKTMELSAEQSGGWIGHHGWKVVMPTGSRVVWPVLPHDQYVKDGTAKAEMGRAVIVIPMGMSVREAIVQIEVE